MAERGRTVGERTPWRDDGELVAAAVAGDEAAFRRLYEENVAAVFGFLARRVDRATAEDLTAETFVRAHQRLDRWEWRGVPIRPWLLRIAHRSLIARSRRRSTGEIVSDELDPGEIQPGPEDLVLRDLDGAAVVAALATLPGPQQVVLELRFLRDLSVRESADLLGSTEEAVRALTYRALRSLRGAMAPGAAS